MTIKERIKAHQEEMVQDLAKLVSYNSVYDPTSESTPFGEENAKCLAAGLQMVEKCGMKPVNLENYIGYGEIGDGQEVVGILGHLDIVPVGEGWDSDPLTLTEKEGKLFGRGVSDDKGAVVASAYAIRIMKEMGVPFTKRVRLIMGCNEESGSHCLAHYVEKEGHIDYGFTPDANFPGIFGEKGMIGGTFQGNSTRILSIEGGSVSNVVCARVKVEIPSNSCDLNLLKSNLEAQGCTVTISEGKTVHLDVKGVAAHAAVPDLGINAISHTMKALQEAGFEDDFVKFYNEKIGLSVHGDCCGIHFKDEYGELTFNNGVISMKDGIIRGTIDIRFPVTMKSSEIIPIMEKNFESELGSLHVRNGVEPLFYPKDSDLVKSLLSAYQTVTNDMESQPLTMGGGTYAKGIKNCIAFGCEFEGEDNHIHDANEFLRMDHFLMQVEIYIEAIKNLLAI